MSREPTTLAELLRGFISRRSKTGPESGWVVLDVTPEECEEVGRDFIGFMAACAAKLTKKRSDERIHSEPGWSKPVEERRRAAQRDNALRRERDNDDGAAADA